MHKQNVYMADKAKVDQLFEKNLLFYSIPECKSPISGFPELCGCCNLGCFQFESYTPLHGLTGDSSLTLISLLIYLYLSPRSSSGESKKQLCKSEANAMCDLPPFRITQSDFFGWQAYWWSQLKLSSQAVDYWYEGLESRICFLCGPKVEERRNTSG